MIRIVQISYRATASILLVMMWSFQSCEDKQSNKMEAPVEAVMVDTITKEATSKSLSQPSQASEGPTPKNPIIASQADLKDFLYQYGKENPETNVVIKTRFGDIYVSLFEDTPLHRANFILLVKNDYFDTTQFHRVSPGFVIQGGNNDTKRTARNRASMGSYLIPNESSPAHKHVRGAFSAAKYSEQNVSAASSPFEFFIVQLQRGAHHLDGAHTVFGRVVKGMDVVDKINSLEVDGSEWPLQNVYMDIDIID